MMECCFCGLCKIECPVFKVSQKEMVGPRGKAILKKKELPDRVFYICTLCEACKEACPIKIKIDVRKMREVLVEKGVETKANKKMKESVMRFGHPFEETD